MSRKLKVLLLNPYIGSFQTDLVFQARSVCQPLSLGIIAQYLRDADICFELLDANAIDIGANGVLQYLKDGGFNVLVTTTAHDIDYEQPRLSLKDIKDIAAGLEPSVTLIVMGTHGRCGLKRL